MAASARFPSVWVHCALSLLHRLPRLETVQPYPGCPSGERRESKSQTRTFEFDQLESHGTNSLEHVQCSRLAAKTPGCSCTGFDVVASGQQQQTTRQEHKHECEDRSYLTVGFSPSSHPTRLHVDCQAKIFLAGGMETPSFVASLRCLSPTGLVPWLSS